MSSVQKSITAAILVIGDEILSGRTKDKNIGYIAEYLTNIGIELREVRVVPDVEEEIVAAVNALRTRYTYLFTTGGIGPTHDDITADCVAKAMGVSHRRRRARRRTAAHAHEARGPQRDAPAHVPHPARAPISSSIPISKAPGFRIGNVMVMAGVPRIMQAMLDSVAPTLETGVKILSVSLDAPLPEGAYAARPRAPSRSATTDVSIGSYPSFGTAGGRSNQIVLRAKDEARLATARRRRARAGRAARWPSATVP